MQSAILLPLSIIYVFVFSYSSTISSLIDKFKKKDKPPKIQKESMKEYKRRKFVIAFIYSLPFCILNLSIVYIVFPEFINIFRNGEIRLVSFKAESMLLFILYILTVVNTIYSLFLFIKSLKE